VHVTQFLVAINNSGGEGSTEKGDIEEKILTTNALLESFGNAKTVRNHNSSRFGKYTVIGYDRYGPPSPHHHYHHSPPPPPSPLFHPSSTSAGSQQRRPCRYFQISGCSIKQYLLEKTRIVSQSLGERNYHIFYEALAGLTPQFK
jgi:myosin heavy subunit